MRPRRSEAENDIAGSDIRLWQDVFALDGAHCETGKVIVTSVIEARHFRRLAADES